MKKVLSLFMSVVILFSITAGLDMTANAEVLTGIYCQNFDGSVVVYTLDTDTGVLTISGDGKMVNFLTYSYVPWYSNRSSVKTVVINSGVTSIGKYAFYECSNLTSVTIPDSVTSIGEEAFYYCSSLTSITIPDSVTSIGGSAFYGTAYYNDESNWINDALYIDNVLIKARDTITKSFVLKDETRMIADEAVYGCDRLTSVIIGDCVTNIGKRAFQQCIRLTSVTIGDGVTSIGKQAFYNCKNLAGVTIPNSVTSIGVDSFGYCNSLTKTSYTGTVSQWCSIDFESSSSNPTCYSKNLYINDAILESVVFEDETERINDYAFYRCSSLTSVTIPDSVTSIGKKAFYCTAYYNDKSNWADDVLYIDNALIVADDTISGDYAIKDDTIVIADYAFNDCESLTSVAIPDSVTNIGNYAFRACSSLKSVTIPDSVTNIGEDAFDYCNSLNDVYYLGTEEQWNNIDINEYNFELKNATIHFCGSSLKTSTNSLYSSKFDGILNKFLLTKFRNSIYKDYKCIIPGIEQTNTGNDTASKTMTPQGVCVAGSYILISAYDGLIEYYDEMGMSPEESKKNSVIYVLNKKTNNYITTIVLNSKCHVGGIAYNDDDRLIYVADSDNKQICVINYSAVVDAAKSGKDAVNVSFSSAYPVSVNPSFVTYYGGNVYVGNFVEKKEHEADSYLKAYKAGNFNEVANSKVKLPLKSQGVAFTSCNGKTYMIVSSSHGRKNKSQIFVYEMKKSGNALKMASYVDCYKFPEMTEDLCVYGNKLLTCYESAAARYQNDNSKNGKCPNPIDRITANSVAALTKNNFSLFALYADNETDIEAEEADDVVIYGECGENAEFVLYSNGVLNITGQGDMYDYSESDAPWSDYADSIGYVYISPDIDSVGSNSFVSCSNLESVTVSDFSNTESTFVIADNAFDDCPSLNTVSIPDKSVSIAENAFNNCSVEMTFDSDSQDVAVYAQNNDFDIHNHSYEYVETIKPTCSTNGYDLYECSCSSEELRNVVDATGEHNYVLSEETPVCVAGETRLYTCSDCQTTYEEVLTEDSHRYEGSVVAPKCEEQGYTIYTCTVCKDSYIGDYTSPTGHSFNGGKNCVVCDAVNPGYVEPTPMPTPTPQPQPTPTQATTTVPVQTTTQPAQTTTSTTVKKPKSTSISKLTKGKKQFKVTWKKVSSISGYQIQYSTDKKFKKNVKNVTAKKNSTSSTIKKLKSKKTYYVRIKTYKTVKINGKSTKVYSSWSKVKTVKTK